MRVANATRTSAGDFQPGETVQLPWDEAQELIRSGRAVRIGTVAEGRMS